MGQIKFGMGQTSNPTPSSVNLWVRVITVAGGIFMGWLPSAGLIGPHSREATMSILGLFLALINGLAPLFGVEITTKNVSSNSVTAVDTDKP